MYAREDLATWIERYLEWMRVHNKSERTVSTWAKHLGTFRRWCESRGLCRPSEVTKPVLDRYQRSLFHHRKKNGRPLAYSTQAGMLVVVRSFFRWLMRENVLLSNPASELELPKKQTRLPRHVMTEREVELVLAQPDVGEPLGLRDRAILETLYATGMRRAELVGLKLHDVDVERQTVMVRLGKGGKDRLIPLGERALVWIEKYVSEVRDVLAVGEDDGALFVTRVGKPMGVDHLTDRVRRHVEAADIRKRGSCHLFRHTMATLMLEHGADVRYVQEMLGHANISTTQLYTRVSIRKLQEVHATTHPGARLKPTSANGERENDTDDEAREELFSSLAAEAAEEPETSPNPEEEREVRS